MRAIDIRTREKEIVDKFPNGQERVNKDPIFAQVIHLLYANGTSEDVLFGIINDLINTVNNLNEEWLKEKIMGKPYLIDYPSLMVLGEKDLDEANKIKSLFSKSD